jgi:hypothetical protein
MVEVVATTKPEVQPDVGAHAQTGCRVAPHPKNPSSMAATALCRQTPKVGAVCPNWARTDLCGGRSVMGVSTAIGIAAHRARQDASSP